MNKKSVARYRVDQRQRWAADVAGEFDGYSGMLHDVMNQRCRRALALCPRNTNDSVLRIIAQKDLRVRRENAACLSGSRNRFGSGGELRLKTRQDFAGPQSTKVCPAISVANTHRSLVLLYRIPVSE